MWPMSKILRRRSGPARVDLVAAPAAVPTLSAIGHEVPSYRKTYGYAGELIDAEHRALAALPVDGDLIRAATPGYLRLADALALYELAYFANGDVLEMGSAWGLSTTILCRAVRSARTGARVWSIELQ